MSRLLKQKTSNQRNRALANRSMFPGKAFQAARPPPLAPRIPTPKVLMHPLDLHPTVLQPLPCARPIRTSKESIWCRNCGAKWGSSGKVGLFCPKLTKHWPSYAGRLLGKTVLVVLRPNLSGTLVGLLKAKRVLAPCLGEPQN